MGNFFGARHSSCQKVCATHLANSTETTSSTNVPNLSEILSKEGTKGPHKYHGPFVYTHIPASGLLQVTEEHLEQNRQQILAQKTFYENFRMQHPEHAPKASSDLIELFMKNACSARPLMFVQIIKAV